MNFAELGLKRLLTTSYKSCSPDLFSNHDHDRAICLEYIGTSNQGAIPRPVDIKIHPLDGDGDFRSPECIDLLKQADIVVTNPPFSLFRDYLPKLIESGKKFLVLGPNNAVTYREIFPYIQTSMVWLGVNNGGTKWFQVRPEYEILTDSRRKYKDGKKYFSMGNINWFTNLEHHKRREYLILYKQYSLEEYPKYDNYNAINVRRVDEIPDDYFEEMGVPITFLTKHNPDQFEIIGLDEPLMAESTGKVSRFYVNGKKLYARIVIRRREQ